MENLSIDTSVNVQLEQRMASVGERIVAFFIDAFIIVVTLFLLFALLGVLNITSNFVFVLIALPFIFYHLICELTFEGQSIGKMIMKIKVVSADGAPVTFGKYLVRWVLRLIDITVSSGFIAVLVIAVSKTGQRIGDMAAGTTLISTKLKPVFDESVFMNVPENYEVKYHQAGDLEYQHAKTLLDVMHHFIENPHKREAILMVYRAKKNLETRFAVTTEQKPVEFIETVLMDFNALHKTETEKAPSLI